MASVTSMQTTGSPNPSGADAKLASLYMGSVGGASFSSRNLPSRGELTFSGDRPLIREIEETVMTTYVHFAVLAQCTLLTMHYARTCREVGAGQQVDPDFIFMIRGKQLRSGDMPLLAKYIGRGQTDLPPMKVGSVSEDGSNSKAKGDITVGSEGGGGGSGAYHRTGSDAEDKQVKGHDLASGFEIVGNTKAGLEEESELESEEAAEARPTGHVRRRMFVWVKFLSVLDLSRNILDESCITPLMQNIVLSLPQLKALVLDENVDLGSEAINQIIPHLKKTRLLRLSMAKCALGHTAAVHLSKATVGAKALHPLPSTLETLDLSNNRMTDRSVRHVLSVMDHASKRKRKTRVTNLEGESGPAIKHNRPTNTPIQLPPQILTYNPTLKSSSRATN
jgi:Leucine-rich repeat (LRR) protein